MKLKFFSTLTDAIAGDDGISIESHSVTEIISDACGYIDRCYAYSEEIEEMRLEVWNGQHIVWSCNYDRDEYPDDGFNKMIIKLIKSSYVGLFNPNKLQQLVAKHEEDECETKTINRMIQVANNHGYNLDRPDARAIWQKISDDWCGADWMIDRDISDEKMLDLIIENSITV